MNQNKQQGFPIIPGMGLPGQRERSQRDIKTDLILVRKQTGDNIVLWTGIFLCLFSVVLIIGPLVGYVVGIVAFCYIALLIVFLVSNQQQPLPFIGSVISGFMVVLWLIYGYAIVDKFWWTIRCEWEPRNKLALVIFLLGVATILFFNMYRFAYEVVDPNSQPTISPRPAEWGIMWPFKQPPQAEPEYEEQEQYSAPRQTPIDEVDERGDNGSPKLMRLSWLPISPEETQRLCVAVVAEGVEFKRQALVNVQAIKLNDYGPVIKVLKERRYLCKSGSGVALTFAGYRWMCKQIPDDMTPLPYTSLGNPVETGGKPTTTVNNR